MDRAMRLGRLSIFWLLPLLLWPHVPWAGAPAPAPGPTGPHRPEHQIANLGDVRFESGEVVKDFKVSYVTHGKLNRAKDNVILVLQRFAGDHHDSDFLMGPGKALDTDKYFIVAPDFVGNSRLRQDLTTGPTNSGLKMEFPRYTIRDSVKVDHKLLKEHLGLDHITAAIGASMGAMKAYQFAVSYPNYVRGIIPMTGSPVTGAQTRALLKNWMEIIALDGGWQGGNYETNPTTGLALAFLNLGSWLYTNQWFAANLKTVEEYRRWRKIFHGSGISQDARDIHYQLRAWAEFNVGDTPGFNGDARAALGTIKAQVLLISAKGDMLVSRDEVLFAKNVIPGAMHVEIDSPFGHAVCCGFDPEATKVMDREIAKFLSRLR